MGIRSSWYFYLAFILAAITVGVMNYVYHQQVWINKTSDNVSLFMLTEFWRCNKSNYFYLFIYFIKIQKEKNVFDRREYIKALKKSKNKLLDCKGHCVSTVQQCKKIACFDLQ